MATSDRPTTEPTKVNPADLLLDQYPDQHVETCFRATNSSLSCCPSTKGKQCSWSHSRLLPKAESVLTTLSSRLKHLCYGTPGNYSSLRASAKQHLSPLVPTTSLMLVRPIPVSTHGHRGMKERRSTIFSSTGLRVPDSLHSLDS